MRVDREGGMSFLLRADWPNRGSDAKPQVSGRSASGACRVSSKHQASVEQASSKHRERKSKRTQRVPSRATTALSFLLRCHAFSSARVCSPPPSPAAACAHEMLLAGCELPHEPGAFGLHFLGAAPYLRCTATCCHALPLTWWWDPSNHFGKRYFGPVADTGFFPPRPALVAFLVLFLPPFQSDGGTMHVEKVVISTSLR